MVDIVALLDRAPNSVRNLAYRVAAGKGVLGRLADGVRFRFSESDIPALPQSGGQSVRLLIGPANSAGQGYQWARAVESFLPDAVATAAQQIGDNPFQPEADIGVPVAVYQRSSTWHEEFESYISRQTHVIWESGQPLLGRRYGSDALQEIAMLKARGVRGGLLFHGSDIRPPSCHAAHSPWSPFTDASGPVRALVELAASNAALAAEAGVPVFVSTPDLLRWLPDATWLPVVVAPEIWQTAVAIRPDASPPVVVHAPTQRWLKGTDRIEPMLQRLAREGVIDYRQIFSIPHASMPVFYAAADIVLDQFLLGSYGVAACEAMASGKLVMGHVDDFARQVVHERTGSALPIHEATVETLEAELRRAAAFPEEFSSLRTAGPRFVDAVHSGRRSAEVLAPFLGA